MRYRVLFAVNSMGLGHAGRGVALARGVSRTLDVDFLFLAGSPALDLVVASGFDAMPIPPAPDWEAEDGHLVRVGAWYRDTARYVAVARRFLRREIDWGSYDALISDGEPASASAAASRGCPVAFVTHGLGQSFARRFGDRVLERLGNRWFRRLLDRMDLVLTLEPVGETDRRKFVGPIVREFSDSREKIREDIVFLKKTILVAPGGTAIGGFVIREAVRAFESLEIPDAQMVVVTGPKLSMPKHPRVHNYGFLPNLQDYVLASDLVITMAGKGTANEALAAGTPVIAIPVKNHAEGERNAIALGTRFEDVLRLRELIPAKLAEGRNPPVPMGTEKAVRLLAQFLADRGRRSA